MFFTTTIGSVDIPDFSGEVNYTVRFQHGYALGHESIDAQNVLITLMQFMHSDVAKNIVANNTAESPITQVFVSITNDSLAAGSGAVSYGAGLHVVNINTTQVNSLALLQ